jgi:hypothetical protein
LVTVRSGKQWDTGTINWNMQFFKFCHTLSMSGYTRILSLHSSLENVKREKKLEFSSWVRKRNSEFCFVNTESHIIIVQGFLFN